MYNITKEEAIKVANLMNENYNLQLTPEMISLIYSSNIQKIYVAAIYDSIIGCKVDEDGNYSVKYFIL